MREGGTAAANKRQKELQCNWSRAIHLWRESFLPRGVEFRRMLKRRAGMTGILQATAAHAVWIIRSIFAFDLDTKACLLPACYDDVLCNACLSMHFKWLKKNMHQKNFHFEDIYACLSMHFKWLKPNMHEKNTFVDMYACLSMHFNWLNHTCTEKNTFVDMYACLSMHFN